MALGYVISLTSAAAAVNTVVPGLSVRMGCMYRVCLYIWGAWCTNLQGLSVYIGCMYRVWDDIGIPNASSISK